MRHFFVTIWSSIRKSKQTNLFNLIGLSVSFASFVLLSIYLWNEFTFDQYNKNFRQVYMLELNTKENGENESNYWLPNPMADYFAENIPELSTLCSFAWGPNVYSLEKGGGEGVNISTRAVDSTFAEMFDLHMKYGGLKSLAGNDGILLSENAAKKLFGDDNPVGKTIYADFQTPYIIEGVFYNLPQNCSFQQFEAFSSFPTAAWTASWEEYSFNHYYQLPADASLSEVILKMNQSQFVKDWKKDSTDDFSFSLLPVNEQHFNKELGSGNLLFARSLVLVALLLLFMAFVNYLNFAIANAPKQRKAINVRQFLGESTKRLLMLSIGESAFIISLSFIGSIFLSAGVCYFWPDIFSYEFRLGNYVRIFVLCWVLVLVLGAIVASIQTRMNGNRSLARALDRNLPRGQQRNFTGKLLTVLQFGISIFLIISVLFVEKQVRFFKNYDLGFSKENIVIVDIPQAIQEHESAFVSELVKNNDIIDYAFSQFIPGGVGMGWGREIDGKTINFNCWPVDERYMNFMGFEIMEGRGFSENLKADENNFIMNEAALKDFGWDKQAIGKQIPGFGFSGTLIGIVKDMKYASLREEVTPLAFWLTETRHNKLSVKISGKDVSGTIAHIREVYSQFDKNHAFNYRFMDEQLDNMYKAEEKQAQLISLFSIVSILISVIGVLGLAILLSEYRIKEIGIRKVNGAKTGEIIAMLNNGFVRSVMLAFAIACPLGYYAMRKWLESFAYKTELSWWIFALAGVLALGIALLTVSFQSYRAATRNPVEALRYE
ncbi:ABC transporter permease [Mangrovibacterium diazotrophicum]|uniref:Putative ABC transport system permease protein n=1 Tax=Mangrovibacterium diazotrophicum TaxID=1261403 RepID=A0A419W9D5_9BACT|nr:ABC transporter permease [Mangrovibacterium diazotrophicum]RKD92073.1 putative ABC transport system permease protein [Mangrovibacterium diazotrophicum]